MNTGTRLPTLHRAGPAGSATAALGRRWQAMTVRERWLTGAALVLVAAAVLWWVALAPALRVLRTAPAAIGQTESQLQRMQAMAAQARELRAQARPGADEALRVLEQSARARLGSGSQLTVSGERATVVLKAVPADALAAWLAQVREGARALPVEARLQRVAPPPGAGATASGTPAGTPAGTPPAASAVWDGTIVLQLAVR